MLVPEFLNLEVVFLGTGDAFGSGGRHPVSILVRARGIVALLDCGPGALPALKSRGRAAADIDLVLVSHHHGDHFAGIPFLFVEYLHGDGRTKPLTVAGPPRTREKVEKLAALLFPGLEGKPPPYSLTYEELEPGATTRWGPLAVTPFRVAHFPQGIALGYRLSLDEKTIVYSGDTEWTDELARASEGADLLIVECSSFEEKIDYHLSYRVLESRRAELRARRTILVHAGEDVLRRRRELVFELAEDGEEVRL